MSYDYQSVSTDDKTAAPAEGSDKPKRGRPSNDEKLAKVHARALKEFDAVWREQEEVRAQCLAERRFNLIPGAQWEGGLGEQFINKVKFEVNKCRREILRAFSEWRSNRVAVEFVPKDGVRGAPNDSLADTCAGLFRADEQDSGAEEAKDNAFEEGVSGGMGGGRVRACYVDEGDDEDTRQRVRIEPIFDADQVLYFDRMAQRADKSDAKCAWLLTPWTHDAFEEEFGHDPVSWPVSSRMRAGFDWWRPDRVYTAEYYEIESVKTRVQVWESLTGQKKKLTEMTDDETDETYFAGSDGIEADAKQLRATGWKKLTDKDVLKPKVHKYILSGQKVESDEGYIAGPNIPLIPYYAQRAFIEGVERVQGHTRVAMDAQRLSNMQRSRLAEIAALSPIEKPIVSPEQIKGHAGMWQNDSVQDYPYLLLNTLTDATGQVIAAQPLGYTKAPSIPPAMAALIQTTDQDMNDMLGNPDAVEQVQPGAPGVAVDMAQNKQETPTFIYTANMARFVKRIGEVWLGMARELYIEDNRKMKTVNQQGEAGSVTLNSGQEFDKDTDSMYSAGDLSRADFDLAVDVGPSSSSRRAATVRSVIALRAVTQDPEIGGVLEAVAVQNMEGEGLSDVRDYFRQKLVRQGVYKPTPEEARKLAEEQNQPQPPDPQAKYLEASAEQALADAGKTKADTAQSIAKTENIQADTEVKHASIHRDNSAHHLNVGKALHQAGQDAAARASVNATQPQNA